MIGIDEVGRGAWAGPLVVAGVRFKSILSFLDLLNDSKKLSKKQREYLNELTLAECEYAVVFMSANDLDKIGLSAGMRALILEILGSFKSIDRVLIDGNNNFLKDTAYADVSKCEVRGDSIYPELMAASIIAKVARDSYMCSVHVKHNNYEFDTHVGYGTAAHARALAINGITLEHRRSFAPIKKFIKRQEQTYKKSELNRGIR